LKVDKLREERGLTRKELGVLASFSVNTLSTGISRNNSPSIDLALRIAEALGVTLEYLMKGEETTKQVFLTPDQKAFLDDLSYIPEHEKKVIRDMLTALVEKYRFNDNFGIDYNKNDSDKDFQVKKEQRKERRKKDGFDY